MFPGNVDIVSAIRGLKVVSRHNWGLRRDIHDKVACSEVKNEITDLLRRSSDVKESKIKRLKQLVFPYYEKFGRILVKK